MSDYTSWLRSNSWPATFLAAVASSVLLVLVAMPMMDEPPQFDELYHILAARGLLAGGSPTIAHGEYPGALLFTQQVAAAFSVFGESVRVARLPPLLAAVGLVAFVGGWVTRRCGVLAGIIAGVFLATSSILVDIALFARFYSMQVLCIAVCGLGIYAATEQRCKPTQRFLWILASAAAALVALSVALWISLMAMVAIGTATVLVLADANWKRFRPYSPIPTRTTMLMAIAALAVIVGGIASWKFGRGDLVRLTSLWAAPRANQLSYYVTKFASEASLIWPLLPAAALVTFCTNRRLAIFCTTMVLMALVMHSLAEQKALRYATYLWPWACILLGYAAAEAVFWSGRKLQEGTLGRGGTFVALLSLSVAFGLSDQWRNSVSVMLGRRAEFRILDKSEPSWTQAVPIVRSLLANSDVLMVSSSMKSLYYLGGYDYEISATVMRETDTGTEFGLDERTGSRIISRPESFKSILAKSRNVVLVLEDGKIGTQGGVIPETVEAIRASCKLVEHVEPSSVTVWSCNGGA